MLYNVRLNLSLNWVSLYELIFRLFEEIEKKTTPEFFDKKYKTGLGFEIKDSHSENASVGQLCNARSIQLYTCINRDLHQIWMLFLWAKFANKPEGATTNSRPPLESSWRGESNTSGYVFLWSFFDLLFFETSENHCPNKNIPRRIGFVLSNARLTRSQTLLRCLSLLKIDYLVSYGSRADLRALDNIVLAHTSDM